MPRCSTARLPLITLTLAGAALTLLPGTAEAASVTTWEKVADCESGGNWSINTGNGYYGGLQFSLSTWNAYGGRAYADYPHQATEKEQILIGEKVLAAQGEQAWPFCGPQAGLGADTADPFPADPTPPSGKVYDRTRSASGAWSSATNIDGNTAITEIAASGLPDGTLHVQSLVNGKVYDRTRSASGAWSSTTNIDDNGAITKIASAALPDGTLHVLIVVNGDIWDRTRSASGSWSSATKIDDNGGIKDLAASGLADGTLHVQALVNGDIWDRTRAASGSWSSAVKIDDNGGIKDLAASGLADGTLHVQALVNGDI
ncbi:transglycosylase family protein, partial [Streptomyces olivaceoviridis]|uniref:transglycosylase family protein n=1 Tax=Streptomyces olivaceoviridis TaxID=1921 RepID=UPI0036B0AA78